jgi:cyclophilin family peptidyl-prolyl cis-trans isomerase
MKTLIIFTMVLLLFSFNINSQTAQQKGTRIVIETSMGNISLLLYDETPLHRDNFIKLVKDGYYDGQLFHRVIRDFMIQGGDPNSKHAGSGEMLGLGGPAYTIPAEFNFRFYHKSGALAAARRGDEVNPKKESAGSQFYIVVGEKLSKAQLDDMVNKGIHRPFSEQQIKDYTTLGGAPHLDGAYTIFGEVTGGMDVVEKISTMPTDPYERPLQDIKYTIKIVK